MIFYVPRLEGEVDPPMANGTSFLLARRGGEGLPVVYAGRSEAGRYAAVELARYLSRTGGCRVHVLTSRPSGARPCLELVEAPAQVPAAQAQSDAFRRTVTGAGVRIEATGGRGLLFGVYDLLEEIGCRWYYPGPVGERVPQLDEIRVAYGPAGCGPALPGRSIILGHDLYLADVEGWVEWAARNRLNNVFLHVFPPVGLGGRPAAYWRQALAQAVRAASRRDLSVEFGGHGLSGLLPRRLFRRHPEFFRFDGHRRRPDFNLCPSSPGALRVVGDNARAYLAAHPGADVYHLWPADVAGGGWCRCRKCARLSPSDQALLATNAVARVLAEVAPAARLAFLAYHDTIEPPDKVEPEANVSVLFAPRERCYAHALDDPACGPNRGYHRSLLGGLGRFAPGRPGRAVPDGAVEDRQPRVFGYYLDAFLFKSMLPPLPRLMARDLKLYRAAGIHTVGVLMTADRPWVAVPPNLWLFSRLTWNPDADPRALLTDFAGGVLGDPGLADYYARLESAFSQVLELDGQESLVRLPGGDLVDAPPVDTLDFLGGPAGARERKLVQLQRAAALVGEAGRELARSGSVPPALAATRAGEAADRELVSLQLEYLEARQAVVAAEPAQPDGAAAAATVAAFRRAWRAARAVEAWGRRHLGGSFARSQFAFVHGGWRLQLLCLERRNHLAGRRPARLRARDIIELARLALRLAGLRVLAWLPRPPSSYHRTS